MKIDFNAGVFRNNKLILMLCAISGALFSLGFTFENCWIFSWLFFTPLAVNIFCSNKTSKRVFCSLFCFFFVFYVCCYSWLVSLYPLDFAGLGNFESILVIMTGLVFVPLIHGLEMSFSIWLFNKMCKNVPSGIVQSLGISFGYVFGEWLQGVGPLGFPWARMYVSQRGMISFLQSAKVFGSYFITFAVVFFGCLIALSVISGNSRRKFLLSALTLFAVNTAFGVISIEVTEKAYDKSCEFTATVLQGNVGSYDKWSSLQDSYDRYMSLADDADRYCKEKGMENDIVLVPETAFPTTILKIDDNNVSYTNAYSVSANIGEKLSCSIITGGFVKRGFDEYNSLVAIDENRTLLGIYDKQKLVPFGEFVPYRTMITTFFPFLSEINMLSSDLAKGQSTEPMPVSQISTAGLVCFDSVFPSCARLQVKNGADVIALSTNDSWYKQSKALEQHAAHAVMRAIENQRPVIRSANTGISMMIEPTGKIVSRTQVDKTQFLTETLHKSSQLTVYTLFGDVTLYCGALFFVATIIYQISKKIRRRA